MLRRIAGAGCRQPLSRPLQLTGRYNRPLLRTLATAPDNEPAKGAPAESRINDVSNALKEAKDEDNNLLAPVHIPEDPHGVIKERHPAFSILNNSAIVVQREIEMMNIMLGFEQANKYVIHDPHGNHIGFMAEQDLGMGSAMGRQFLHTHRSFTTHVFDRHMKEVLRFHRPLSWISSRIKVYDPVEVSSSALSSSTAVQNVEAGALSTNLSGMSPDVSPLSLDQMRIIGEAQQQWAMLRRKYNLFLLRDSDQSPSDPAHPTISSQPTEDAASSKFEQFAFVDERFLSWDFSLLDANGHLLGSVNRNFTNFGREIFTDTGCYALRMDAAGLSQEPTHLISNTGQSPIAYSPESGTAGMTLDQRAMMLATAVSIDFDYFSRQRSGMFGGMMPMWMGGAPAEGAGGAAVGEAAGTGVVGAGEAGAGIAGRAGGVSGAGEGAIAGAGTMAGYEAMQRGMGGGSQDDASPTASNDPYLDSQSQQSQMPQSPGQGEEVWGEQWNPQDQGKGESGQNDDWWGGDDDGDGDGGGGGWGDFFGGE